MVTGDGRKHRYRAAKQKLGTAGGFDVFGTPIGIGFLIRSSVVWIYEAREMKATS